MRAASLVVIAFLVACDRPKVAVICHNANCVEPTDPEADDTLPAMRESLQLEIAGKPAIDAIELDSFWRGTDDICLFAHDLVVPTNTTIAEAATELATHITDAPQLTRSGGPFYVFLELKQFTDKEESVHHTPEQRLAHADCAWAVYDTVANAAMVSGREVEVVFASFDHQLLRAVITRTPPTTPIRYQFDTFYGIPKPLDSQTSPLDNFRGIPITIVEMHPHWIHDAQWEGVTSIEGISIAFWTFSLTVETFAAIEQYEPEMVGTSEAQLLARWLEN